MTSMDVGNAGNAGAIFSPPIHSEQGGLGIALSELVLLMRLALVHPVDHAHEFEQLPDLWSGDG